MSMRATLRLIGVGGVISYRALFNWTTPTMFAGSLLAAPLTQLLFFTYVGRQLHVASDRFYIVGNAVLVASFAGIFGGTMAVTNERRYGTLASVLLSPRSRVALFFGRILPYAGNGIIISVFTLVVGSLLLGLRLPWGAAPGLGLAIVAGALSCSCFGLVLGALGLRLRDIWLLSNVAHSLLLLLTGVNVPSARLPRWMAAVSNLTPVTHAAQAARRAVAGAGMRTILPALGAEFAVGAGFALLALLLLRLFENEARRHATLDTW
jgi:ABC-2 type transport system permease protein